MTNWYDSIQPSPEQQAAGSDISRAMPAGTNGWQRGGSTVTTGQVKLYDPDLHAQMQATKSPQPWPQARERSVSTGNSAGNVAASPNTESWFNNV